MDFVSDNADIDLNIHIRSVSPECNETSLVSRLASSYIDKSQQSVNNDSKDNLDKFKSVFTTLTGHVEEFCKSANDLQHKRDFLQFSLNIIKQNDLLEEMADTDRKDIECYIKNISTRLYSVDVRIGRTKNSDSIQRIDKLINSMACCGEVMRAHKHCEQYLNACENLMTKDKRHSDTKFFHNHDDFNDDNDLKNNTEEIDMEFCALLLDIKRTDCENIRNRLWTLMKHINYQIARNVE